MTGQERIYSRFSDQIVPIELGEPVEGVPVVAAPLQDHDVNDSRTLDLSSNRPDPIERLAI
jgi:hypothetical protein